MDTYLRKNLQVRTRNYGKCRATELPPDQCMPLLLLIIFIADTGQTSLEKKITSSFKAPDKPLQYAAYLCLQLRQ